MELKNIGEELTINTNFYLPTFKKGDRIKILEVNKNDLDQPYKIKSLNYDDTVWIELENVL